MNIIVDSKFNPFTYTELTAPLKDYREEYAKAEALYSDLVTQTEAWADIANRENSPEAYEMYRKYSNRLGAAVDAFSVGMTPGNRTALLGLKRDYAREITPIANAATARKEALDYRDKIRAQDNTAIFELDELSLDNFLHGRTVSNTYVSGRDIQARVATAAQALSKELRENPDDLRKLVGGDFFEYIKEYGFSSDAVLSAIANNSQASKVLLKLVDDALKSSGVDNWDGIRDRDGNYTYRGRQVMDLLRSYANEGLWQAVGTAQTQVLQNWRTQENLSHIHALDRIQEQHENDLDLEKTRHLNNLDIIESRGGSGSAYRNQIVPMFIKNDGNNGHVIYFRDNENITIDYGVPVKLSELNTQGQSRVKLAVGSAIGVDPEVVNDNILYGYGITLVKGEYKGYQGILIMQSSTRRDANSQDMDVR